MSRNLSIFSNLFLIGLVLYLIVIEGLRGSDWFYVFVMSVAPISTLFYIYSEKTKTLFKEDSIVSLWIEYKKQKLKSEINKLKENKK